MRYAFFIKIDNYDFMAVTYDNDNHVNQYFESYHDHLDDVKTYIKDFLNDTGNLYTYHVPNIDCVKPVDIFKLKDNPIPGFDEYLVVDEPVKVEKAKDLDMLQNMLSKIQNIESYPKTRSRISESGDRKTLTLEMPVDHCGVTTQGYMNFCFDEKGNLEGIQVDA